MVSGWDAGLFPAGRMELYCESAGDYMMYQRERNGVGGFLDGVELEIGLVVGVERGEVDDVL